MTELVLRNFDKTVLGKLNLSTEAREAFRKLLGGRVIRKEEKPTGTSGHADGNLNAECGVATEPESGKAVPLWIALLVSASCLVAGCLQPSFISEEERIFEPDKVSPVKMETPIETQGEILKETLPPKTYLIDTGLYHVGDSWEYESVVRHMGGVNAFSRNPKRVTRWFRKKR